MDSQDDTGRSSRIEESSNNYSKYESKNIDDGRVVHRSNYDDLRSTIRNNSGSYHGDSQYATAARATSTYSTTGRQVGLSRLEDENTNYGIKTKYSESAREGIGSSRRLYESSNRDLSVVRRKNELSNISSGYGLRASGGANYAAHETFRSASVNPRTRVLDINITLEFGGSASREFVDTRNAALRTSTTGSSTIIDNVHYIDLDLRSPGNTAQLSTDGIIHQPLRPDILSNVNYK